MKKFRHQRKQRKRVRIFSRVPRLILYRSDNAWDGYRILYQDPDFYSQDHFSPDKYKYHMIDSDGFHYQVVSQTFPQLILKADSVQVSLMGTSSSSIMLTRVLFPFLNTQTHYMQLYLSRLWKALDSWARGYNWPTEKPKAFSPRHIFPTDFSVSPYISNLVTRNPSEKELGEARYMVFYSF